jgi:predicted nucleotidyltransferase
MVPYELMSAERSSPRGLSLLKQESERRSAADERERLHVRECLAAALGRLKVPGPVWVYGSLVKPGRFGGDSDVDLAFESLPADTSLYLLQSLLSEAVGREVDVCLLGETRLRDKIVTEGERWT